MNRSTRSALDSTRWVRRRFERNPIHRVQGLLLATSASAVLWAAIICAVHTV